MKTSQTPLYIGIDGGGSKTAAVVAGGDLTIAGEGHAGPSNHLRVGIELASRAIEDAMFSALREAGAGAEAVAWTYCGIAGSDHPEHRRAVVESLEHLFPSGNFTVDNDARIALTAGIGFGPGVALIAGTGSVAFGRNAAGEEARAGGWGPTIGDEGSGYWIAVQGLSSIAQSLDGRAPRTIMAELLCTHYGMCKPDDLPYFIYSPSTHADDIARYCQLVIEAAMEGDEVAREIFRRAGRHLAATAGAVARRLRLGDEPFEIACSGGAFASGPLLIDPLTDRIREEHPAATVRPARERPVVGAVRMAIEAARNPRPARKLRPGLERQM